MHVNVCVCVCIQVNVNLGCYSLSLTQLTFQKGVSNFYLEIEDFGKISWSISSKDPLNCAFLALGFQVWVLRLARQAHYHLRHFPSST